MKQLFKKRITKKSVRGFLKGRELRLVWDYRKVKNPFEGGKDPEDMFTFIAKEGYSFSYYGIGITADRDMSSDLKSQGYSEVIV